MSVLFPLLCYWCNIDQNYIYFYKWHLPVDLIPRLVQSLPKGNPVTEERKASTKKSQCISKSTKNDSLSLSYQIKQKVIYSALIKKN